MSRELQFLNIPQLETKKPIWQKTANVFEEENKWVYIDF